MHCGTGHRKQYIQAHLFNFMLVVLCKDLLIFCVSNYYCAKEYICVKCQ